MLYTFETTMNCVVLLNLFANSLKDVQKRSENVNIDEDPSGWRPYSTFVEYLQEKCVKLDLQGTLNFHVYMQL